MIPFTPLLALASSALTSPLPRWSDGIAVPLAPPSGTAQIEAGFLNYAIEYRFFNEYSGDDVTGPNIFSYNLIQNIADKQGAYPIFRIGGNSQSVIIDLVFVILEERR